MNIDKTLEQQILLNILYFKKHVIKINTCRVKKTWLNNHISNNAYEYLLNRFSDLNNKSDMSEILYRLYYNIEFPPLCNVCNKANCKFIDFQHGYAKTCSYKCSLNPKINNTQYQQTEILNDEKILEHFLNNESNIISTYASKLHIKQYGYESYLYNRFSDIKATDSIQEIIYRIKNNIETKPKCPICGKEVNFKRFHEGYRQYCSLQCSRKSDVYYQHKKETYIKTKADKWKKLGFDIKFNLDDTNTYTIYNKCNIHNPFKIKSSTFFNRWSKDDITLCPICNPERNNETSIETIIKDILIKNNIKFVQHTRNIIKPKELDFYLEDYKIGIECNGIYWHSDLNGKNLMATKYNLANANNIQLLTFWEDDIHYKKDIIESIIKTKCGLNQKIYARKCIVKEIDSKISKEFIDNNHLQGNVNASIKLGLFYNNELVQVMTFGKLRKALGAKSVEDNYELYRLCTKQNISVIGGASKLLAYFKNNYKWSVIISYCHNEISNGNVYKKLGFTFDKNCGQGYTYYNYKISNKRINRFNLRKSKINDNSGLTADEILFKNGYIKCYDAGVTKYKLLNKSK